MADLTDLVKSAIWAVGQMPSVGHRKAKDAQSSDSDKQCQNRNSGRELRGSHDLSDYLSRSITYEIFEPFFYRSAPVAALLTHPSRGMAVEADVPKVSPCMYDALSKCLIYLHDPYTTKRFPFESQCGLFWQVKKIKK